MSARRRIDPDEVERLARANLTYIAISKRLLCTPARVSQIAISRGIRRQTVPPTPGLAKHRRRHKGPHRKATIKAALADKGIRSANAIALELGLSRNAVIGIWNRHAPRAQVSQ